MEGKAREGWRDREERKQAAGLPHQASRAYEHSNLEERPFRRAEHCQWEDQQQAADCDGPPTDTDGRHPEPASTNPLRHSRSLRHIPVRVDLHGRSAHPAQSADGEARDRTQVRARVCLSDNVHACIGTCARVASSKAAEVLQRSVSYVERCTLHGRII